MGYFVLARVLFDSGAEVNVISEALFKAMNLTRNKQAVSYHGITGEECQAKGAVNVQITAWFDEDIKNALFKQFIIMKSIPVRSKAIRADITPEFKQLVKADPDYDKSGKISVLLGVDTWAEIVKEQIIRSKTGLIAQNTTLGYVIFGSVPEEARPRQTTAAVNTTISIPAKESAYEIALDQFLERFWQIEELHEEYEADEHKAAEQIFQSTTSRDSAGRYIVRLPLIESNIELGDSKPIAMQRFYQLERRLERNPTLREQYNEFMKEYEELGHMRLATSAEKRAVGYIIPHHPILSRFRVVYDAGCPTSNGKSVNDIQLTGPNRQEELDIVIMRFRTHKFVFASDIKKMFRQILVHEQDLPYQQILWRPNPTEPIKQYVLTTVTYGMKSSPFLALRTMLQLADDYADKYPLAAYATRYERYMDDYMTGADNEEQLIELYNQLIAMLKSAMFELDKWKTNCPKLIKLINTDFSDHLIEITDEATSILGLKWQPSSDCFTFEVTETWKEQKTTKRAVLRAIARIYDPCGFLAPVIIMAKSYMQWLWKQQVDWDEDLQVNHNTFVRKWSRYYDSLQSLNELKIPRWLNKTNSSEIALHGFADASEVGYGAAVYIRCRSNGKCNVSLLASKTRVAPVKPLSIPRLELNAALLLSVLVQRVQTQCNYQNVPCHLYTDSMVTLCWINACPAGLKQYVANRVVKITQNSNKADWRYIPTKQNPADMSSRGLRADELIANELWWNGPHFLRDGDEPIVQSSPELSHEDTKAINQEQKSAFLGTISFDQNSWLMRGNVPMINYYDRFNKLIRITAFIFKAGEGFKRKSRAKELQNIGLLSPELLKKAVHYWVRYSQLESYASELNRLEQGIELKNSSSLSSLCPFLDTEKIIRVEGRIANAVVSYDEKHPIIIPPHSEFGRLLVKEAHESTLHGGVQQMLHYVRAKYWLIGARRTITRAVKSCNMCRRYRKNPIEQLMGHLPAERTQMSRPFANCGVDYFGPMKVKRFMHRCKSIDTGYGAVFVCLTTRMIHIETVTNLTTERFLWALQRFASHYGMPEKMFSDNGTTFKGAASELKSIHKAWRDKDVTGHLNQSGTIWRFITPRAPFQGGIWEAAVKSTKHHMRRILKGRVLTYEEYQTLFAKISSVLNSRPIAPLNDNPHELNYLTPSHAIRGERSVQPLAYDLSEIPESRLKQHTILDKVQQEFWSSFRRDYLSTLQSRYKWKTKEQNLKVDDIVLIKEDNLPPGSWLLGRVTAVYPGNDGLVRNVRIQTKNSQLNRAVRTLVKLSTQP